MQKIYFFLIVCCNWAVETLAQNGVTSYSCTLNGQTQTTFNIRTAFVIDNTGNKWVGFNSGYNRPYELVRFNGTSWDSFPHVPSHKVNALVVDAGNTLWIGTDSGLVKFNGSSYTVYNTGNSGIASNIIYCLAAGGGNIYAGTNAGLSVFNGSTFTNYNNAQNGLSHDTITVLEYENPSNLWIGNRWGLENFNGSNFTFMGLGAVGTATVNCIYIDGSGNKWLGTTGYGVVKYDNANFFTMQQVFPPTAIIGGTWPSQTYSISKGPTGGVSFILDLTGPFIGLGEINGTNLKVYKKVGYFNPGFSPPAHSKFRFDNSTGKLFYMNTRQGTPTLRVFLYSFDPAQNVEYGPISASNSEYLDINNVAALITANADMGWDGAASKYFVPKTQYSKPLFNASVWMGGFHNGGLRMAAMTYRQNGMDFWPGPLDTTTAICDSVSSMLYNRVWKIDRFDIANFIYNWNAGNVQNGTFIPHPTILNWPAHGAGNFSRRLAPFVDINNNGIYDPINDGDYPMIKGDQMIWRIINDNTFLHTETGGTQFGAEIHASAYAYICPGIADSNRVLNYTTFYNYKIINRSSDQFDSCYVSNWLDTELGNGMDDHIGCDVMNNYGYVINGDSYDDAGYLDFLPIFACNVLNGPAANANDGWDNNNNGIIDEANEPNLMHSFTYYTNTGDPMVGNPSSNQPMQYYNFMSGKWRNGVPMTYGGNGTIQGNPICKHLFPGNSDPYGISMGGSISNQIPPPGSFGATGWTQSQGSIPPADMRFLTGCGPFTMLPGGAYEFDFAYVFSQDSLNCYGDSIIGPICTLPRAQQDNIRVKRWFDTNSFPSCLSLTGIGVAEHKMETLDVRLYPNPAQEKLSLEVKDVKGKVTVEVLDVQGRILKGATFFNTSQYITLPLDGLSPGFYSIHVKTDAGRVTKKFIKQ